MREEAGRRDSQGGFLHGLIGYSEIPISLASHRRLDTGRRIIHSYSRCYGRVFPDVSHRVPPGACSLRQFQSRRIEGHRERRQLATAVERGLMC